jgi:hypothetical protein
MWIDVCCRGGSARDHDAGTPTVAQLLTEMDRLHIDQAWVMSAWAGVISPEHANGQLFEDVIAHDRLLPVPEVLPEGGEQFLDRQADGIAHFVSQGAVAGVMQCKQNSFVLAPWCSGELLEAMQAVRLPLMVMYGDVDHDHLYQVLCDFPDLPIIFQEVPRVGYNRVAYPLLKRFSQLYLVCDPPHFVHVGMEYLVNKIGHEQLLFGTRFPLCEGGSAISGITYANISNEAREAIAGGNVQRLMKEIQNG